MGVEFGKAGCGAMSLQNGSDARVAGVTACQESGAGEGCIRGCWSTNR